MARQGTAVVADSRRNRGPMAAYLLLAVATAVAIGLATWAKDESSDTAATVKASNPCVDQAPGKQVRLSAGCAAIVDNINLFCARNPRYCARSERRAVQIASAEAARREIGGPVAGVGLGGGGGTGNDQGSRSPNAPSRPEDRGGGTNPDQGDGGGENGPERPTPPVTTPSQPPPGASPPPASSPKGLPQQTVDGVNGVVDGVQQTVDGLTDGLLGGP